MEREKYQILAPPQLMDPLRFPTSIKSAKKQSTKAHALLQVILFSTLMFGFPAQVGNTPNQ